MGKPNGKSGILNPVEAMIQAAENSPVRAKDFAEHKHTVNGVLGMLQQQVSSLDIAFGLMVEVLGRNLVFEDSTDEEGKPIQVLKATPWTKEQVAEFKAEHQRRFEQFQEKIIKAAKESKKTVLLA